MVVVLVVAVVVGAVVVPAQVDILAEVAKNATNVVKWDTLLAIATKVAGVIMEVVGMDRIRVVTDLVTEVATEVEVEGRDKGRPVSPAEDTVTCLVIVPKAKSATTVCGSPIPITNYAKLATGGELGHLSRDCSQQATSERVCYKCKQPGHVQAACPN